MCWLDYTRSRYFAQEKGGLNCCLKIRRHYIPIYSNLESADKTNNFHFVALMLFYEPLPIKYKIEYLVKKVKSKKMRHFVQVFANLRNIVFHRISRGLEPLPDYAPEYYYGLYGDWEFFF